MNDSPTIVQLGDNALLVTFAQTISWETGMRVRECATRLRGANIDSVTDIVPGYTTLAVYFHSARISHERVAASVAEIVSTNAHTRDSESALIEIPVKYDGPDLAEVADRAGLTIDDVIARHSSRTYRAYVSGFMPGFAYLGDLDDALVLPRRAAPRIRVPAGSVAIAGAQTAVYPLQSPGGWHLIGTTSATMFDAHREIPALIHAGDTVRFMRVD